MSSNLGGAAPALSVRDSGLAGAGSLSTIHHRYRAYPTPGQQRMLARTFGCARVVFNDAIRARQDAYAVGESISDKEVQRRVVTLAKTTPERQWLGDVAS